MCIPKTIQLLTRAEPFRRDETGMSGSEIRIYEDKVLKIQPCNKNLVNERRMMTWLRGKLPVPEILAYEEEDGMSWLLMTRLPGQMACADRYMADPALLVRLLARGLKDLWEVDTRDCPVNQSLSKLLADARRQVEQGLVDLDNVQPETFGEGGFENPEALLHWLEENRPEEEPVLSHGDYCLPNVFFQEDSVSGFLDLGRCGVGDKWFDIALCYRSLQNNFSGLYGRPWPGLDPMDLFRELDLQPNWEKLRYYILLDELF